MNNTKINLSFEFHPNAVAIPAALIVESDACDHPECGKVHWHACLTILFFSVHLTIL